MNDGDVATAVQAGASEGEPAIAVVANDQRARQARIERRATITRLMNEHSEAVFGFCMRLVRIRALAEDLTQQVFLEAHRDLHRFEGRSSPRGWLFGIAYHRCIDALKRGQRRLQLIANDDDAVLEFEDPGPSPLDKLDGVRITAALEGCLKRLSPDVRATVLMRFQSGSSYEELAVPLGATPQALQLRVSRALHVLRRCLRKKGWTGE